eukprot:TRINITY_DN8486_c0_g1_i1.p1 TRINITY_DN8486_c0_g1~~TRINITY_DN8486_c0_g1_i1.p1  ORF type:complete len:281 (+),score=73.35 TRINITY_DN8486_c0_g1_i1:26-844(+)
MSEQPSSEVSGEEQPANPIFRNVKQKNFRKRTENTESKEPEEIKREELGLILAVAKEKQKLRYRTKPKLQTSDHASFIASSSLDTTFTVQSETVEIDPHLEKFIQEKMITIKKEEKEEKTVPPAAGTTEAGSDTFLDKPTGLVTVDDLYRSLKDNMDIPKPVESSLANFSSTTIPEVELPIEYKLKNIEETEKAKKQLLIEKQKLNELKKRLDEAKLPTNFNSNYSKHHSVRDFGPKKQPRDGQDHKNKDRGDRATDDLVAENFRKKFRMHK